MSITERQKVLRLVVKEVLIDDEKIRVMHSIPLKRPNLPPEPRGGNKIQSYLLRSGRHLSPACQCVSSLV